MTSPGPAPDQTAPAAAHIEQIADVKESETDGAVARTTKERASATCFGPMDAANKAALAVLLSSGPRAAATHMMSGGVEGQNLSYAEMRAKYG